MKMFKKIAAGLMALAMLFAITVSSMSVSAAGMASQMLTDNQRKFYNELVKKYVTDFAYGSTTSFSFWFRDNLAFDTSEGDVTTEELFVAAAMFVADYAEQLPWLDTEGAVNEEYPLPFLAASVDQTLFADDEDPENDMVLKLAVAMFAVKEDYAGTVGDLFGYPNITIINPVVPDFSDSDNLALNATVTVESTARWTADDPTTEREDLAKDLANDADYSSRWQAQTEAKEGNTTWIALDFGSKKSFDRLRIYWETARANADGYTVQVSNNGTDWTDVPATVTRTDDHKMGESNTNTFYDQVALGSAQTARYVRLYITAGNGKGAPSIYEFEVYNGEPGAPVVPVVLESIEITKNPDRLSYPAGTYAIPDLTGMELTLHYSDDSTDVLDSDEIKALQGHGSGKIVAFIDEFVIANALTDDNAENDMYAEPRLAVNYLGFETYVNITLTQNDVNEIEITSEPTGEGLRGLELTTNEGKTATVADDADPYFAVDMMGYGVAVYVAEYDGNNYLLLCITMADEESGEESAVISFMGANATLGEVPDIPNPPVNPDPPVVPGPGGDVETGVESAAIWFVLFAVACAAAFTFRKVRA